MRASRPQNEIYTLRHNPGEPPQIIEGKVLLVRAPTVDTGDVQFAHAVGIPPPGAERFKHLPNVVIFSIRGESPLLSSLARGDMDGDLVSVIYDRRLFPMRTEPAMQHKPKRPVVLDRDCTIKDVIDFVLNFFRNDMLGQIATRVSYACQHTHRRSAHARGRSCSTCSLQIKLPRVFCTGVVHDILSARSSQLCRQLQSMVRGSIFLSKVLLIRRYSIQHPRVASL